MNNLEALIGRACGQLTQRATTKTSGATENDLGGLMFFGNPMETTPRRLLLDDRLTPVDKIGWMAFRMSATLDREMSFPTYGTLQKLLSSRADGATASRSTVNRVIYILRLTRWLTLCHQARNTLNGRMVGNIYALHDEPIAVVDSTRLDSGYLGFVSKCRSHNNQSVRKVAEIVFAELTADKNLRYMMTQMGIFEDRLKDHSLAAQKPKPKDKPRSAATKNRTQATAPGSNFELSDAETQTQGNSPEFDAVQAPVTKSNSVDSIGRDSRVRNSNAHTVRTLQKQLCKSVRTTLPPEPEASARPTLNWSRLTLNQEEQTTITHHLQRLAPELHQAVLDEAAARSASVRNMTGYLLGLIEKAHRGEFKITQIPTAVPTQRNEPQPRAAINQPPPKSANRDFAPADISALLRTIGQSIRAPKAPTPSTSESSS